MNLARVEYYFSDVLSCIETREPLKLHANNVPLEGSAGIQLFRRRCHCRRISMSLARSMSMRPRTRSATRCSTRAIVINMSAVELRQFSRPGLETREPALGAARAWPARDRLAAAHGLMARSTGSASATGPPMRSSSYHANFRAREAACRRTRLRDDLMMQKVLVKLRGAEKQRGLLTGLLEGAEGPATLDGVPEPVSWTI